MIIREISGFIQQTFTALPLCSRNHALHRDLKWYKTFSDHKEFTVQQSCLSNDGREGGCLDKKKKKCKEDELLEIVITNCVWQRNSKNINIIGVFMRRKSLILLQAIFKKLKKRSWHLGECRVLEVFGGDL